MTVDTWIVHLAKKSSEVANLERACSMAAYMKNKFDFYGIPAPQRKLILKEHWGLYPLKTSDINEVAQKLWQVPQREMHYNAMDLLSKRKNKYALEDLEVLEHLIITNSWWDSVDYLAGTLLGAYFKKFPQQIYPTVERWENGNNLWLHRSAIIFQLKYREDTNIDLLFYLCARFAPHKDFFIRKAIGWALRSVYPYKKAAVVKFVQEQPLSPLSKREALKHHK